MLLLLGILCALLYLAWFVKDRQREGAAKRELAKQACEKIGHDIHRISAWDDPRFPVDRCRRCQRQWPVQYPCPHCGEELGAHGYRSS